MCWEDVEIDGVRRGSSREFLLSPGSNLIAGQNSDRESIEIYTQGSVFINFRPMTSGTDGFEHTVNSGRARFSRQEHGSFVTGQFFCSPPTSATLVLVVETLVPRKRSEL